VKRLRSVSAERRLSFEQWEQKFAAGRAEIENKPFKRREVQLRRRAFTNVPCSSAERAHGIARWLGHNSNNHRELTTSLAAKAHPRNEHAQQLES